MTALSSRKRKGLTSWINQENTAGYIFSLPFIIGFLMFMVIPMAFVRFTPSASMIFKMLQNG